MSTSPSVLTDLTQFLGTASQQAAAWYGGLTGSPLVVPATSSAAAAAQQIALQQQAQANLAVSNPTLAGLLANPVLIVLVGLALLALIIFAFRR